MTQPVAVPHHPFVSYRITGNGDGRALIECVCQKCKTTYQKLCSNPQRASYWVFLFAREHGHGLVPVVPPR